MRRVEENEAETKPPKQLKRKKSKRREVEDEAPAARKSPGTVRAVVIAGASATLIGIALVGTHESITGAFLVIGGMLALIGSIHMLGRLGPDTPPARSSGQSQRGAA